MREGTLKSFLYKAKIIPLYSYLLSKKQKIQLKRRRDPNRWYYRFLPIKKKKIVFSNFRGKGYGDNPQAIAEEIIRQKLDWDMVWLTSQEESFPPQIRQVRVDSRQAMRELATAKLWVFNVRNQHHPRKRKGQQYIQTWHGGGVLVKNIEGMAQDLSPYYIADAKEDGRISDYILSSDSIRTNIIKNFFWINPKTQILEFGTPKDDIFFQQEEMEKRRRKVREQYGINDQTFIILYMPTFRDNRGCDAYNLDIAEVIAAFRKLLNKECCLFLRLHPLLPADLMDCSGMAGVVNVSAYPEANDFFAAADCAISDYTSSTLTKMPLLHKPSFIFASDFEEYKKSRGLTEYYEQLPIPICETNEQLLQEIRNFDPDTYFAAWDAYYKAHPSFECGQASYRTVELMKTILSSKER